MTVTVVTAHGAHLTSRQIGEIIGLLVVKQPPHSRFLPQALLYIFSHIPPPCKNRQLNKSPRRIFGKMDEAGRQG